MKRRIYLETDTKKEKKEKKTFREFAIESLCVVSGVAIREA